VTEQPASYQSNPKLKRFESGLAWLVGVHLAFVVSAFMPAISDRWSGGE
jgi:hypothetical protein